MVDPRIEELFYSYLRVAGDDKTTAGLLVLADVLQEHRTPAAKPAEPAAPGGALTVDEAAGRLNVSRWTIYRLARAGSLRGCRVGSVLRFPVEEIERFENESGAASTKKTAPQLPGIRKRHY